MLEAGPGITAAEATAPSAVTLEALRALDTPARTIRAISDNDPNDPLDPTWLTRIACAAENDPLLARSLANHTVARWAVRAAHDIDLTLAVSVPSTCAGAGGTVGAWPSGDWAAVRPPGMDGVVALLPDHAGEGPGLVHFPLGSVRVRPDSFGQARRDLWLLDLCSDVDEGAQEGIEGRAVRVALRAADDAVAVGLMRTACKAAAEDAREQRLSGWSEAVRAAVTADLCLDYEAAVAMSIGAIHAGRALASPEQDLLSCLSRYWTGRSTRRIAARRATTTGPHWPDLDPTALALFRHAAGCAASGGTAEQVLSDVDATLTEHPGVLDSLFDLVQEARGHARLLDDYIRRLRQHLLRSDGQIKGSPAVVREIALLVQAWFVARTCPGPVEEAFLRTRLGAEPPPYLAQGLPVSLQSTLIDRL